MSAGPAEIPRLAEVGVDGGVIAFTLVVAGARRARLQRLSRRFDSCAAIRCPDCATGVAGARQAANASGHAAHSSWRRSRSRSLSSRHLDSCCAASNGCTRVRPGFDADGVATLWLAVPSVRYPNDSNVVRFYAELTDRVAQLPGVRSVGITSRLPLGGEGMNQNPFFVEGDANNSKKIPPLEIFTTTDGGYFRAMGIPLIAGTTFDPLERQHPDEAIISLETAKTFFHDSTGRAALNRRFQELPNGMWHTVVGVVGSVRDTSLAGSAGARACTSRRP